MSRTVLVRIAVLALLAVLASASAWRLLRSDREAPTQPSPKRSERSAAPAQDPPPSATAGPPVFPRTAVFGNEVMGINEAVSVPLEAMGGLRTPLWERDVLRRRGDATAALGSRLVRASSHVWPYLNHHQFEEREIGFGEADRFFQTLGAHGLDVVVVIGPWPGARTALYTKHYLPDDLDAYGAWVQQLVERYDGDGVEDMPGLEARVVAWEIDNEPDLHNASPPRGVEPDDIVSGFQTPQEYATVLLATERAIRRADPQAMVLSGGIYRPMTASGRDYLERVLEVPGVRDAIDGISLHCYFSENNLGRVRDSMATVRELSPELPVWITETSVPSDSRRPWINEDWQARMVAGVYGAFLAEGADRVFWHSLTTPPARAKSEPRGFGSNALMASSDEEGWVPKPAALVYERLAAHLASVEMASVHEVAVSGGRLLATDQGWLAFWGEPHPPDEARIVHDLMTGERRPVQGPVTTPAWLEP